LPLLIKHALGEAWSLAPEAEQAILNYPWPGNVQQLLNVLEKAKLTGEETRITLHDLPRTLWQGSGASAAVEADTDDLCTIERRKVVEVLRRERGNKARAARALGIDRRKLYRLLEKYSIDGDEMRAN
jgi:transcriptional regulator of acetoin/glycerol metabolism